MLFGPAPRPAALPGGGSNGSSIVHCASVSDEDEYAVQRCPRDGWGGHDEHNEISNDDIGGLLGTGSESTSLT
ncbi:hypothetical protein [Rhodococcus sp. IEGM 1379]|uniref:hypothetical protein n=1 Tax=Rhodococcus sp. IEGM 1379 TaxID=3047086 RepID=UPI0024B7FDFA|nr:hypothetical protein [Rhodococcus sp. IEGM 1379]MDI9916852.1 hypothetical protein [Rhodococcus sp. IEGM 1379]